MVLRLTVPLHTSGSIKNYKGFFSDGDQPLTVLEATKTAGFTPSLYPGVRCEDWQISSTNTQEKIISGLDLDLRDLLYEHKPAKEPYFFPSGYS